MGAKSNLLKSRRLWAGALLLLLGILCVLLIAGRRCAEPFCVLQAGAPVTRCADARQGEVAGPMPLTDSQELVLEGMRVARESDSITVSAKLKGAFRNETDQNLYIFVGQSPPAGAPASYALSADVQYFTDLPYQVRHTIELPHSNDLRVGIMAPREAGYTPQVYISDPVRADLTGSAAKVGITADGHNLRLRLPLEEYYGRRSSRAPERVSVTLATARDYVGFVDQLSATDVAVGETKEAGARTSQPALYPSLDYDSHRFRKVALEQEAGSVRVAVETEAEINDWAQTNLNFFFVPYPVAGWSRAPADPSGAVALPAPWSFYCGVYSPRRIFCKESNGNDFTYDRGYSERARLEAPEGVGFRRVGDAKYVLDLSPAVVEKIKAGGDSFALLLTVGRDGFGPTTCYGWNCSGACNFLNRCRSYLR